MMLSAKQKRAFTLAISLFSEKHVSATKIIEDLGCSEATLTRSLRDLRETYNVTIKYSKSTHSYQLTDTGNLTKKDISHMKTAIEKHDASDINDEMKVAAAYAIAGLVSDEELNADYILPAAFDPRVKDAVAAAVAEAARKSGVARI